MTATADVALVIVTGRGKFGTAAHPRTPLPCKLGRPLAPSPAGGLFLARFYDAAGFYAAAFAAGIVFNLAHLTVIGALVWRQRTGAGERSR